mmetsp:Transcript_176302/g.428921  ORF Transcript_176302/g.428921 Transcript_176302/m.428921 type:complete len:205 (+) Transcript_176302:154-768(+)
MELTSAVARARPPVPGKEPLRAWPAARHVRASSARVEQPALAPASIAPTAASTSLEVVKSLPSSARATRTSSSSRAGMGAPPRTASSISRKARCSAAAPSARSISWAPAALRKELQAASSRLTSARCSSISCVDQPRAPAAERPSRATSTAAAASCASCGSSLVNCKRCRKSFATLLATGPPVPNRGRLTLRVKAGLLCISDPP